MATTKLNTPESEYSHEDPSIIDHIRSRPGMYIGGLASHGIRRHLLGLVHEVLGDSGAKVHRVDVTIDFDGFLGVKFHGAIANFPTARICLPFQNVRPIVTEISLTSIISRPLELQVVQELTAWRQRFIAGLVDGPPVTIEEDSGPHLRLWFRLDPEMFPLGARVDFLPICGGVQALAVCHRETVFNVEDRTNKISRCYHYPDGPRSYLEEIEQRDYPIFSCDHSDGSNRLELGIIEHGRDGSRVHLFVNGVRYHEAGSHTIGLERGFAEVARRVREKFAPPYFGYLDRVVNSTVAIALELENPNWTKAYREGLQDPRAEQLVYEAIVRHLPAQKEAWINETEKNRQHRKA